MENKKVISWSLIVLFLSLSIVYSLTYQKKESLFRTVVDNWDNIEEQTWFTESIWTQDLDSWFVTQDSYLIEDIVNPLDTEESESISLWDNMIGWTMDSDTIDLGSSESSSSVSLGARNNNTLPGTTEYFGTLDIVSVIGEKPKFTLQDSKWNFFVYYWDHLDFIQSIEALGGSVYEMVTESEILNNQLFGDRVSYINLSMFKDVRVIMVVKIDSDVWLLQIPADKYHYSKDYLKSLFIH